MKQGDRVIVTKPTKFGDTVGFVQLDLGDGRFVVDFNDTPAIFPESALQVVATEE